MQNYGSPLHLSHYFSKQQTNSKQTRNPTTDKKIQDSSLQFKRSNPFHPRTFQESKLDRSNNPHNFYEEEIMKLTAKRQRCMSSRSYQKAQRIDKKIKFLKQQLANHRLNKLIWSQKREKRSLSQAHQRQMHYLNHSWKEYFARLQNRERTIFEAFRTQQQQQIFEAKRRTRQRCRSHSTSRQILQLQKKQMILQKTGDFQYLKHVKGLLNQALKKQNRRRSMAIQRSSLIEQERLRASQSKKYAALVERLQEYRRDKERIYLREQKRLKQKYRNVLQKLQHQQKSEIDFLQKNIDVQL